MTLKDILNGRNYEIEIKEAPFYVLGTEEYYKAINSGTDCAEFIIQDLDNKQVIIKIRDYSDHYEVKVYNKKQIIEDDVVIHMIHEIEKMYEEQELEKQRKKEEEARRKAEKEAAKFEQKKNIIYQNLSDIIKVKC